MFSFYENIFMFLCLRFFFYYFKDFSFISLSISVNNSEHAAYLLQWVYRCCEKVKLGKTE